MLVDTSKSVQGSGLVWGQGAEVFYEPPYSGGGIVCVGDVVCDAGVDCGGGVVFVVQCVMLVLTVVVVCFFW